MALIDEIVSALRRRQPPAAREPTIGDWPMSEPATILLARFGAVAAAGADIVKVGIEREPAARIAVLDDTGGSAPLR